MKISMRINNTHRLITSEPMTRLLDIIREDLGLMGTKEGCGEGECGACSIIMNGELVNSCLIPVGQVSGAIITTIEGIGKKTLSPVQKSFLLCGGAQCGICTPGMIMAATSLILRKKRPTPMEIRESLAGNLCRCTGYQHIVDSVVKATQKASP